MKENQKPKKHTRIETLYENKFLNFYHMDALTDSGRPFDYYFVSRNKPDYIKALSGSHKAEGIVIYPILRKDPSKIILIRQWRYPLGDYLYELPAGLIDGEETKEDAAIREMKEETGFIFTPYLGGESAFRNPFYMGAGYTDEASACVFGFAEELPHRQALEDTETIEVLVCDKEEVRRILREEKVSLRAAYLLMQFLQSSCETPFSFLDI